MKMEGLLVLQMKFQTWIPVFTILNKDDTREILDNNTIYSIWNQVDIDSYSEDMLRSILDWRFDRKAFEDDDYIFDRQTGKQCL